MKPLITFFLLIICLECPAQSVQDTILASNYIKEGKRYFDLEIYDSAKLNFKSGIDIYARYHEELPLEYGLALFYLGQAYFYNRESEEANGYFNQAQEVLDPVLPAIDSIRAKLYNNLGGTYINIGYRVEAKPWLEKSLQIDEIRGNKSGAAVVHYNLGLVSMYFGESFTAIEHFMSALPAYLEEYGENGQRVAQLYTNIGILHRDIGEYDLAESYFQRGIDIHMFNHGPDFWNLAYPYTNLATLHSHLGQNDLALEYYLKAEKLCKENPEVLKRLESIVAAGMAITYNNLGEYALAHQQEEYAIEQFNKNYHPGHQRFADFYRIRGNTYLAEGKTEEAQYWFDRAIDNLENIYGPKHPGLALTDERLAVIYLEEKEYDKALEFVQKGYNALIDQSSEPSEYSEYNFPDHVDVSSKKDYIRLLNLQAQILQMRGKEGDLLAALDIVTAGSEALDRVRQGFLSEESKLFIQENALSTYENAVRICKSLFSQTGDSDYLHKAFYFFEKSKSTVLAESMQYSNMNSFQGISSELVSLEKNINRRIRDLEIRISEETADSVLLDLRNRLFSERRKADSLSFVIQTEWPDYYALRYNTNVISAADVMDQLTPDEILISYMEGDSSWYYISLTNTSLYLNEVSKSSVGDSTLAVFRELISDPASAASEYTPVGYRIYKELLLPALERERACTSILIIPDGLMYYIPIDALPMTANTEKLTYLIEKYSTLYASSATLSMKTPEPTSFETEYLGFAPEYSTSAKTKGNQHFREAVLVPLNGNQEEVNHAGKLFNGKVFTRQDATESLFRLNGGSAKILHLAAHAVADDKYPMNSGLWFTQSGDSLNDDFLQAYEIYNLRLNSELVVLSACNTGSGQMRRGEGVMSLSRAFMFAGCPNIVMSLWRASDQPSSEIMGQFFEYLDSEYQKDEALRMAKLDYLQKSDPVQSHPAYWASLALVGNDTPLMHGNDNTALWVIFITSGISIFGFILYILKKNRT